MTKQKLNMPMQFSDFEFFLDFEASGLHEDSYPIEVGVFGSREKSYDSLIVPVHYWNYWSHDSQEIHGIPREQLYEQGRSVIEVTKALNERFDGKILWADSSYDKFWMEVLYEASPYDPTFRVANIYDYMPDALVGKFKSFLPEVIAHRALQDAMDIKEAWFRLLDECIQSE